ncbi:MAG: hypothetical protein ABIN05_07950 [candidate division WOR-3 bacterium]
MNFYKILKENYIQILIVIVIIYLVVSMVEIFQQKQNFAKDALLKKDVILRCYEWNITPDGSASLTKEDLETMKLLSSMDFYKKELEQRGIYNFTVYNLGTNTENSYNEKWVVHWKMQNEEFDTVLDNCISWQVVVKDGSD